MALTTHIKLKMTELKTLKDIFQRKEGRYTTEDICKGKDFQEGIVLSKLGVPCIPMEILKQEAIKWIKELEPKCKFCKNYKNGECYIKGIFQSKIEEDSIMEHCFQSKEGIKFDDITKWIKYFFNITEKELK